jgi:hypothetical protein
VPKWSSPSSTLLETAEGRVGEVRPAEADAVRAAEKSVEVDD